jgi:Rieske Fe-S protein
VAETAARPIADDPNRRDFIHIAAGVAAIGAAGGLVWPLIDQMNPSADTLALASVEFDLAKVAPGQQVVIKWRGKPLFVRNRTPAEIAKAIKDDKVELRDPQTRRGPSQARQGAVAGAGGNLHAPGLRADLRRRRLRRLVLPMPRIALRHLRPHP